MVISKLLASLSNDGLLIGLNLRHILLRMEDRRRQDILHISVGELSIAEVPTEHGPSGLVVMLFGGLEDTDVFGLNFAS